MYSQIWLINKFIFTSLQWLLCNVLVDIPNIHSYMYIYLRFHNRKKVRSRGGVLPYKRLMGMCRWMGSHFHDWIDYNGVTFLVELLEWGRTFSGFLG